MRNHSLTFSNSQSLALIIALLGASIDQTAAQELPQPTKQHEQLKREVGVWDSTSRVWMAPGTEPLVSQAIETCVMCGPFWLLSTYEGEFGGEKFVGKGQLGYDKETGEFISTWIDSMVEDMLVSRGSYDVKTQKLTLVGDTTDWMTGEKKTVKMITHNQSEEKKHFEIHEQKEGSADWVKTLEIDSVLRK